MLLGGAGADLEQSVQPLQNAELQKALLDISRAQYRFIESGSDQFVQEMATAQNTFLNRLKKAPISRKEQSALVTLLDEFNDYFKETVETYGSVDNQFQEVENLVGDVTPLIDNLLGIRDKYQANLTTSHEAAQSAVTRQFLIAVVLIPLVLVAFMVALSVGASTGSAASFCSGEGSADWD